jgi:GntR family transcriptional regulator
VTGPGEPVVEIDPTSPTPPYEQIQAQITRFVAGGELPPGTPLPAIRQLAADLGLATNTVARAYRELEAAGVVVTRVGHGTTVAAHARDASRAETRRRLDRAARAYLTTARQLGAGLDDAVAALRATR